MSEATATRRAGVRSFGLVAISVLVGALVAFGVRQVVRARGQWRGLLYRVTGRRPDPNVDDHTLADRVRSMLGPLEKRLDVPRVHVMVENHTVLLHGDVEWPHEAATITKAVRHVSGVRDVESHLHIGMLRSDTRPSSGRG
jgi:osmotically-inducible protein OsmY